MANSITDAPVLDILPPPAPGSEIGFHLFITLLIIAIGLLLYRYWLSRPMQRARRGLRQLQSALEHNRLDRRQCLFEINRMLCLGFRQHNLSHFLPSIKQDEWQRFYQRLNTQQYSAAEPDSQQTRQLLQNAQTLLRDIRP